MKKILKTKKALNFSLPENLRQTQKISKRL